MYFAKVKFYPQTSTLHNTKCPINPSFRRQIFVSYISSLDHQRVDHDRLPELSNRHSGYWTLRLSLRTPVANVVGLHLCVSVMSHCVSYAAICRIAVRGSVGI